MPHPPLHTTVTEVDVGAFQISLTSPKGWQKQVWLGAMSESRPLGKRQQSTLPEGTHCPQ